MVGADQHPPGMGDDQADPADHTADGNGRGGHQGGANNDPQFGTGWVHPEGLRFHVPQGEDVQPPADEKQEDHAANDDDRQGRDIRPGDRGQASEQPEGDGGEGVERVRQILQQGDQGIEERSDQDAHQGQNEQRAGFVEAAAEKGQEDRQQTEDESEKSAPARGHGRARGPAPPRSLRRR